VTDDYAVSLQSLTTIIRIPKRRAGPNILMSRARGSRAAKEKIMSSYRIHSLDSAPEKSKPALQDLKQTFGFLPNLAGAMAESPVLIDAFAAVFHRVHAGSFSEAELQVLLLTNAVTNSSAWPVALHSHLALAAGVAPGDVQAIRERRVPKDRKRAALSALARAMIEKRGHLDERDLAIVREAGLGQELVLEAVLVVAASTITNYTASIAKPSLEAALQPQAWSAS
jgi:alkylhydroperoxidase family enzyme